MLSSTVMDTGAAATVGVSSTDVSTLGLRVLLVWQDRLVSTDTVTILAGVGIVLAIEVAVLGYKKSSVYRLLHPSLSTRTDIIWFAAKLLGLQGVVFAAASLGLTVATAQLAEEHFGFHLLTHIENPVLRILVFVLVSDFLDYWVHRARHQFRWWWEFHKSHHSAAEFNAITSARGHPVDGVGIVLTTAIPVALLGGSMGDSVWVLTISAVHSGLTHSILPWRWGWFGRYVLYSPTGHRIHHSPLAEHTDKNFGGIFVVWDWLFGTYYKGDSLNQTVGVNDNYQNIHGLGFDLVESYRRAYRSVVRRAPNEAPEFASTPESLGPSLRSSGRTSLSPRSLHPPSLRQSLPPR
jgi:sterol desaturase/sphingolipid hydroxylase (fatty acid hydroxylase superfamily)